MKRLTACASFLTIVLCAAPGLAQQPEDPSIGVLTGGDFAYGNLFVRDLERSMDPVIQLKDFFESVRLPLNKGQEQKLNEIVAAQQKDLRTALDREHAEDASSQMARRVNLEYLKQVNAVLTPEQQAGWRHYRVERSRLIGGFTALRSILEEARQPLSVEQEKPIETVYDNFAKRRAQVISQGKGTDDLVQLDNLTLAEFHRVAALLTIEQRIALLATRPVETARMKKP